MGDGLKRAVAAAKRTQRKPLTKEELDKLLARTPKGTNEVTVVLWKLGVENIRLHYNRSGLYFYFAGEATDRWETTMILTPRISDQTIREWVKDFENLSGRRVLDEGTP
jgi:hypothetical protein